MVLDNSKIAGFTHPIGAVYQQNRVLYTSWCPPHNSCSVSIRSHSGATKTLAMSKLENGYFQVEDSEGKPGDLYTFTVDGDEKIPDFASRFQPNGVHEASQVIDPATFQWKTADWVRPKWNGHVLYEIHIGTFTQEGTYLSAISKLDYLRDLGITAVELMPLAEWAGARNWGYDGVLLMAPSANYGTPDDLRTLIDACHSRGISVILDAVFNHLGAVGNVSTRFSPYYFHQERNSPWGSNFDLDGANSAPVRAYLLQVLKYWLEEYRIDGFRMDATHAIHDESETHLMADASKLVHDHGGFIIAEDERNFGDILQPTDKGGWGFDAVWADDFHHSIHVGQLGHDEIYRDSYLGTPDELSTILREGWLYTGQLFPFTKKPRGTKFPGNPESAVVCLSNHDQTGNRIGGEYLHHLISIDRYKAVSLFFLLVPYTPLLFVGQEWACSSPFYYFTDLPGELGKNICRYRKEMLADLFWEASERALVGIPDPQQPSTFQNCKMNWDELEHPGHAAILSLYKEGLKLRRSLFGSTNPSRDKWMVETAENRVTIRYRLDKRHVEVSLYFAGSEEKNYGPRVLLSSNESRFLCNTDENDDAETVIRELND